MKRTILVLFFVLAAQLAAAAPLNTDFKQCANANPTIGECKWITSVLQSSNSDYHEGMSVPQRIIFSNIPATAGDKHNFTFEHRWSKGGIHAYDFLTAWNQGNIDPITLNPCDDAGSLSSTCTALRGSFSTTINVPDDPFMSKDGPAQTIIDNYESINGDRQIRIYANAPVSGVTLALEHSGNDTGDSDVHYVLNWTSNATAVMIELGGHLAVSGSSSVGWGPGLGAGNINGGSYHFITGLLDGQSIGTHTNSIQAGAVQDIQTGNITIIKHVVNDNDGKANASEFTLRLNSTGNSTSFSGSEAGTTFTIEIGAYGVTEDPTGGYAASYSGNCTGTMLPGESRTCIVTNDDLKVLNCTQAVAEGLLHAEIDGGNGTVWNDANQSYIVSMASYRMYALTLFDQTLYGSQTDLVPAHSNRTFTIDLPMCANQVDIVCGEPKVPPYYDENETLAYHFNDQEDMCIKEETGDVSVSVAPWFPQNRSYVFLCDPTFTATSYDWYFGDGTLLLDVPNDNVFHTYGADGNYTVTCTAYGDNQTGVGTLAISIGSTIGGGNGGGSNQTNETGNQTGNQTGGNQTGNGTGVCGLDALTATCDGGTITLDDFDGSCRRITCTAAMSSLDILACQKPDEGAATYYEMYKLGQTGTDVTRICIGSACISDNGFATSPLTCNATAPPAGNGTGNGTNEPPPAIPPDSGNVSLSIAPWFPQGSDYVFLCDAAGAATYDWYFGDGEKLLGVTNSDVYHSYASAGMYNVSCLVAGGSSTLAVNVS